MQLLTETQLNQLLYLPNNENAPGGLLSVDASQDIDQLRENDDENETINNNNENENENENSEESDNNEQQQEEEENEEN